MPKKGRARRFREARELKQGYDDGLFADSGKSLADADATDSKDDGDDAEDEVTDDPWNEEAKADEGYDWDPDRKAG